jgi:hypothetical protein
MRSWPHSALHNLRRNPLTDHSVTMCRKQLLTSSPPPPDPYFNATRLYRTKNCTYHVSDDSLGKIDTSPPHVCSVTNAFRGGGWLLWTAFPPSSMRSAERGSLPAQPMYIHMNDHRQLSLVVHVFKGCYLWSKSHISCLYYLVQLQLCDQWSSTQDCVYSARTTRPVLEMSLPVYTLIINLYRESIIGKPLFTKIYQRKEINEKCVPNSSNCIHYCMKIPYRLTIKIPSRFPHTVLLCSARFLKRTDYFNKKSYQRRSVFYVKYKLILI